MKSVTYIFLILLTLITTVFTADAQSMKAYIRAAEESYEQEDYYSAYVYYSEAYEFDDERLDLAWYAAHSARQINAYTTAEKYYQILVDQQSDGEYPEATFYLAQMKQLLGKYEEAVELYNIYLSENEEEGDRFTQMARKQRESSLWAQDQVINPRDEYEIEHIGETVNTPYAEFGAARIKDSLYYNSMSFEYDKDTFTPDRVFSKLLVIDTGLTESSVMENYSREGTHTAHITYNPDENRLYYTICRYITSDDIRCEIYMRSWEENSWSEAVRLNDEINMEGYTATQPNVGTSLDGGEVLYFVSDRPGVDEGDEDFDIYRVDLDDEGTPQGPVTYLEDINTAYDDLSPNYHIPSRRLYFSSDGYLGLGGLDIYKSHETDEGFTKPQNLGSPINTSYNDLDFVRGEEGKIAYFSSNRPESYYLDAEIEACCYDIYKVNILKFADLIALTFDAGTGDSLTGVTVTLHNVFADTDTTQFDEDGSRYLFPLERDIEYMLVGTKEGYLPDTIMISTIDVPDLGDIVRKLYLRTEDLQLNIFTFDADTREPLLGTTVTLLDITDTTDIERLELTNLDGHDYYFDIKRDHVYRVIASRKGYKSETAVIDASEYDHTNVINKDLYLERGDLEDYLPLVLFFNNDRPVENSWATTTRMLYRETYPPFYSEKEKFVEIWSEPLEGARADEAAQNMRRFFELEVEKGMEDLSSFLEVLEETLDEGRDVTISLKGYASPRASAAYNRNLSQRRISSVKNEFTKYNNGALSQYLRSGQLSIVEEPYGETRSPENIPDDLDNIRESIYSISASKERRVEIIKVDVE